eukprot:gene2255-2396_t
MKFTLFAFVVALSILQSMLGFAPSNTVPSRSARSSTIVMDGKSRILRDRIKSVKNTRRITEAMRLVAAARVRRAQESVLKSRPISATIQTTFRSILSSIKAEDLNLPILEVRDVKKVALVLVTGDRGLCGGYNSAVIKSAARRIEKLRSQGIEVELVLVGKKGEQWFSRRSTPVLSVFPLGASPATIQGAEVASLLIALFLEKEIDAAEIIYTRFNNLISSEPSIRTLLPLSLTGIESEEDEVFKLTSQDGKLALTKAEDEAKDDKIVDYIFEGDPAEILQGFLRVYFSATVCRCCLEAIASELASRMTAMQSASNNAKKIVETLGIRYNRARQASVTQEMLEIVGGATALE